MVWSRNDHWMVTADQTGYVKYWQSNMNNVKMFQAHKEPVRAIRCEITTGFGDVLLTCICIIDSLFSIHLLLQIINSKQYYLIALRNKISIQTFSPIKSNYNKSVTFPHLMFLLFFTINANKIVFSQKENFTYFRSSKLFLKHLIH